MLKQRKPHLVQQLDDFGTFLMRQDVKVDELNVWDFKGKAKKTRRKETKRTNLRSQIWVSKRHRKL